MKKLMIAATIAAFAAATQASQITWKTGNFSQLVDHNGTAITTAAGYNDLMGENGRIVLVLLNAGTWDGAKTVLEGQTGIDTGTGVASFKTSGGGAAKYGVTGNTTFDYQTAPIHDGSVLGMMYQDGQGALSQLVYWDAANNKIGDKIDTTYTVSGMSATLPNPSSWSVTEFFSAAGVDADHRVMFTTAAVPEPTSGLLLLLGVAGLALRRRRA